MLLDFKKYAVWQDKISLGIRRHFNYKSKGKFVKYVNHYNKFWY